MFEQNTASNNPMVFLRTSLTKLEQLSVRASGRKTIKPTY